MEYIGGPKTVALGPKSTPSVPTPTESPGRIQEVDPAWGSMNISTDM